MRKRGLTSAHPSIKKEIQRNSTVPDGFDPDSSVPPAQTITRDEWLDLLISVTTCLVLLLAVAVGIRLLGAIGHTLIIFSLGGLLAYTLEPLVERVRGKATETKKQRPRWYGVLLVFLLLFAVGGLAVTLLGRTMVTQAQTLVQNHEQYETAGHEFLARVDVWLDGHGIPVDLEQYLNHPPPKVKGLEEAAAAGALTGLKHISTGFVESIIIFLIALYFLIYSEEMRVGFNRFLPRNVRPYAVQWQNDVNRILGGFVRGQLLLALLMGVMAALACAALGISYWLLIGLFVVVASLVPVFGPYIGMVPAVIAAALTPPGVLSMPVRVILLVLAFFIINEVGSKVLYPRLVGAALGLHEVVVLFVLFAGYEVGHIWGVLFAAPLTALGIVTVTQLYRWWQGAPPVSLSQEAVKGGKKAEAQGVP